MSDSKVGKRVWIDATFADAPKLRDFYANVIGWTAHDHPMNDSTGDYADYSMRSPDGTDVAGVINQRGMNSGLPPVWIPYFAVANLEDAKTRAIAAGGEILDYPSTKVVYVRDPAGAIVALVQAGE